MEEANKIVNQTMKVLDPMASVVVGTVTGSVDAFLRHLTMVQKLSLLLQEAELANKDLQDMLAQQSMDVEKFKQEKMTELQKETGLSVTEAEEKATKSADEYWVEKYSGTAAFVQIDNRDCFEFEKALAGHRVPFTMMPIHTQDHTSVYMVHGEYMEQIKDIAKMFESRSLFMDIDQANEFMNNSFVRKMDHIPYIEMKQIQADLAAKGIASRIVEDPSKNTLLITEKEIRDPGKDKLLANAIGVAEMQKGSKLYQAMDHVRDVKMKAFEPIDKIIHGEKVKGITIYDSAHPENYIVLKNGGAIVYEDHEVAQELNLANRECVEELEAIYHSYTFPASTEKKIQELSQKELAKPYVTMSLLEQMSGIQKQYLEHLFEDEKLQLHIEPDSKESPSIDIADVEEQESLLEYNGNGKYMAGIIESGKHRMMESVGILNITNDSDNTVTALTNSIEIDSSNMQAYVDQVRTSVSAVTMTTEMYEKEIPAVDDGRADVVIEDREQDIDPGNGDYGSRFNDDPNYDIGHLPGENMEQGSSSDEPDLSDDMF